MYTTGNKVVDYMQTLSISGNVTPHNWYRHVTKENGKPYLLAIAILSDIVYWYRPTEVRDEMTGQIIGMRKKFKGDALQRRNEDFAEFFGESVRTVQRATARLEELGLIRKEVKDIRYKGGLIHNAMFIELMPERLAEITFCEKATCEENFCEETTYEEAEESESATMTNLSPYHDKIDRGIMTNLSPYHDKSVITYTKNIKENTTEIISSSSLPPPCEPKEDEEDKKLELRLDYKKLSDEYQTIAETVFQNIRKLPYVEQESLTSLHFRDICQSVSDNAERIRCPDKYIGQVIQNLLAGQKIKKSRSPKKKNGFDNKQNYDFDELEKKLLD